MKKLIINTAIVITALNANIQAAAKEELTGTAALRAKFEQKSMTTQSAYTAQKKFELSPEAFAKFQQAKTSTAAALAKLIAKPQTNPQAKK